VLFAGGCGGGDDVVEALITAQIIPAWIKLEIAVGWTGRDRRDNFELLERAVALTRLRVNQRQVDDELSDVRKFIVAERVDRSR